MSSLQDIYYKWITDRLQTEYGLVDIGDNQGPHQGKTHCSKLSNDYDIWSLITYSIKGYYLEPTRKESHY